MSRWLILSFVLALLAVVAAVNLIVLTLLASAEAQGLALPSVAWIESRIGAVLLTSFTVLGVVGLSSLFKSVQLSEGGGAVARDLGGVRVERAARDALQRRLFNVVEEMAIASGIPVPEIYLLEHEEGINAFAAGHLPANAAVAVTRGALEQLTRSELQGVIAHEFGHILNGDMRINTRLLGLLFGLLVVALIGRTVLRFGPRRSRRGGALLMGAALAVMVLGYLGVFFGRIIQAAVSRRRETLADASAVQFTRDPFGLKGALVKIGGLGAGSRLHAPQVDEVAHMLFAPGMTRLFATHPPLIQRIRTLDPGFQVEEFNSVRADPQLVEPETRSAATTGALSSSALAQLVGTFDAMHVAAAHNIAGSLPLDLIEGTGGASAVLLALALDPHPQLRALQLQQVVEALGPAAGRQVGETYARLSQLQVHQRLPMLQEASPELRRLPQAQRRKILQCLNRLILTDGRIEVFEYALATLARTYLRDDLRPGGYKGLVSFRHASVELQALFSAMAEHGATSEADARHAYDTGMHRLLPRRHPPYKPIKGWPASLDRALKCVDRLAFADKEQLVQALTLTISHDRQLTLQEAELLRAICAAIHCPLPPFMSPVSPPSI